jgi:enoyl-CoA hydratase/carnithine racemase
LDFKDILYAVDGPLAVITLNRPAYRNAQGYRMLDEIDRAFALTVDLAVKGRRGERFGPTPTANEKVR